MTREEVEKEALQRIDNTKSLILELTTGFGKTKLAISLINHLCDRIYYRDGNPTEVLIVVPRKALIKNWQLEIEKWGGVKTDYINIICYASLHKYRNKYLDVIVFDEIHNLSLAKREILQSIHYEEALIGLSATISREQKDYFKYYLHAQCIQCSLPQAIESNILPEPRILLYPMHLDTSKINLKTKRFKKDCWVTQRGYYNIMSANIEYYKDKYNATGNIRTKNLWLSLAGKRLKWLAEQKENTVLAILNALKNYRTLTFCNNIEQSERLGKYNITSKNKKALKYIDIFNAKKIKHITAVTMLNEGLNLVDCKYGIFCNLNSSERYTKQKLGRLLRHPHPVIIVPYYKNTREETLVHKMFAEYDKNLITEIHNINEICNRY